MKKKLLTLQDLFDFYSKNDKSIHFDANENGEPISVQVEGKILFDSDEDHSKDGLTPVHLQACHTDRNLNSSNISNDVMTSALPSFSNRPILGYIHEVDGEPCFYGHNYHIDDNGEIVYDEIPVGIIPESCDAKLVEDDDKGHTYVEVSGYIFDEYTKATEILQREKELAVSVEINILDCSFNPNEKCLYINSMYFSGVTILQKTALGKEVKPGMEGSNIKLMDFNQSNNSLFDSKNINLKLIDALETLNSSISKFNIDNTFVNEIRKEEQIMGNNESDKNEQMSQTEEVIKQESSNDVDKFEQSQSSDENEQVDFEIKADTASGESDDSNESSKFSMLKDNSIEFELSHSDIRHALYELLEATMENESTWYYITDVYDKYFVYEDYNSDLIYGQGYIKDDTTVAFSGDRYQLFKELLTVDEKAELDSMRANYSSISQELSTYKQAERMSQLQEVINDPAYAEFIETDGFKAIKDKVDTYSVEDLRTACDLQFAKEVKSKGKFSLESIEKEKKAPNPVFSFAAHETKNNFLDSLLKTK